MKRLVRRGCEQVMKRGFAAIAYEKVVKDEEVLFFWAMLCASIDNDIMEPLLNRLVRYLHILGVQLIIIYTCHTGAGRTGSAKRSTVITSGNHFKIWPTTW